MPIPDSVTAGLTALQQDADDLAAAQGDADARAQAAADAQHQKDVADAAVASTKQKFAADKAALHKLIDDTYQV